MLQMPVTVVAVVIGIRVVTTVIVKAKLNY